METIVGVVLLLIAYFAVGALVTYFYSRYHERYDDGLCDAIFYLWAFIPLVWLYSALDRVPRICSKYARKKRGEEEK